MGELDCWCGKGSVDPGVLPIKAVAPLLDDANGKLRRGGMTKVKPDLSSLWFPSPTAPLGTLLEFHYLPIVRLGIRATSAPNPLTTVKNLCLSRS